MGKYISRHVWQLASVNSQYFHYLHGLRIIHFTSYACIRDSILDSWNEIWDTLSFCHRKGTNKNSQHNPHPSNCVSFIDKICNILDYVFSMLTNFLTWQIIKLQYKHAYVSCLHSNDIFILNQNSFLQTWVCLFFNFNDVFLKWKKIGSGNLISLQVY